MFRDDEEEIHDILIVDDETKVLEMLKTILENSDAFECDIYTADDGKKALKLLEEKEFDLVLADQRMPGLSGIELLTQVKEMYPNTVRILITGYSDLDVARDAINRAGVHHYLEKPLDNETIINTVQRECTRMIERRSTVVMSVEDVVEALEAIRLFRNNVKSISDIHPGIVSIPNYFERGRHNIIFEFDSPSEFNKFSFELKNDVDFKDIHEAKIEDVQVFDNKYIVNISFKS